MISASFLALTACSSRFRTYDGPEVTSVHVYKGRRRMYLLHHEDILRELEFELGFAPVGNKNVQGDGRTPEGAYFIDRKNPNSSYHLSLGISYPNARDRARAAALGRDPGGDIFIHGTPSENRRQDDWTAGCIAITNREVEDVYAMVKVGTPIYIFP